MSLSTAMRRIRAVVLDVDGVLTDGRIGYGDGAEELKFFNVKDGHGIVLLRRAGYLVGIRVKDRVREGDKVFKFKGQFLCVRPGIVCLWSLRLDSRGVR